MITVTQLNNCPAPMTDAGGGKRSEPAQGGSFESVFMADAQRKAGIKPNADLRGTDSSGKSEEDPAKEEECAVSLLYPAACLLAYGQAKLSEGTSDLGAGSTGTAGQVITDILEGNNQEGDTDIASLLATMEKSTKGSDSAQEKASMARMPQMIDLLGGLNPDAAEEAAGPPESNLCPLENGSDKNAAVLQNAVKAPNTGVAAQIEKSGADAEKSGADIPAAAISVAESAKSDPDGAFFDADSLRRQTGRTDGRSDTPAAHANSGAFTLGAAGTHPTASVEQAAAEKALAQITESLITYEQQGSKQIELQLDPEHLGKLTIRLSMGGNGLSAEIRTGNTEIRGMIAGQLHQLVESLQNRGIQVENLEVLYTDMGQQSFDQQSKESRYPQQDADTRRIRVIDEESFAVGGTGLYDVLAGMEQNASSVEYRV